MYIKIKIKEEKNRLDFEEHYSPIVCGNSNYCLEFNFDEAWSACTSKTAIFVVDGKKAIVNFKGNTLIVPEMPNAPFLILSLQGYVNDEIVLNTTGLKIAMQESPGLSDLSELEPLKVYFNRIVGAISNLENGNIVVKEAGHAQSADTAAKAETASHALSADRANSAGSSDTEVDLSSDQEISGVKNFTGDLQVNGKSLQELAEMSDEFVKTSGEQTIDGDKTFTGEVMIDDVNLKQFISGAVSSRGVCNGNVLLNSNFKINQRGKNSYTGDVYTVDRWHGYEGLTVNVVEKGIEVISAGKNSETGENLFMQKFEWGFETFGGRTLTLSAKVGGVLYQGTAEVQSEFEAARDFIIINLGNHGGSGDDLLKFKVDAEKIFSVAFDIQDSSSLNIEYVKLEFGNLATEYCPPQFAEEILKCQRYYFQTDEKYVFDVSKSVAYLHNNHIYFPVPMRVAPKISIFSFPMDEAGVVNGDIIEGYYYNVTRKTQGLSVVIAEMCTNQSAVLKESEGKLSSNCLYSAGLRADAEI